jgi:hypothetical protein
VKNNSILPILLLVLAFFAGTHFLAAQAVNGLVVDENGEPLPGVAVQYNQSLNRGTVTDLDGKFSIPDKKLIQKVVFSFIGYQSVTQNIDEVPKSGKLWVIQLKPGNETLQEVDVVAGVNPALRMVRNAIKNRDANNPRKYASYKYVSYNKDVITYKLELPDSAVSREDTLQFMQDTAEAKGRHLLVIESVTRKLYKSPNHNKEIVIGTKISGFQHPGVAAIPDGIQNFGFHENIIPMVNKKYLNPIADGADRKYVYIMKDTLYDKRDTIYVMDYFPEQGANFEGFRGELTLHTKKWALIKITAHPFDKGKVNLYVEQDYQWVDDKFWFPRTMNFSLDLERMPFRKSGAVMHGKTYLDSVVIGQEIPDEEFNHIQVDITKTAGYVSSEFWEDYRQEELTTEEVTTYQTMDSIGKRYQFDALLDGTRNIYDGFIAIGKLDVEIAKLVAANQYEGWRLGLGLYTNDKISEKFKVGGYFGYGYRDQAWKYGGMFRWYFNKNDDLYITANYLNDVRDPGGIRLKYKEWGNVAQQFFNVLMDRAEEAELSMTFRTGSYSKFKVGMRYFGLAPTYDYQFLGARNGDPLDNIYRYTEAQLWYRWQFKEKYTRNYGQRISQGSKWPIVNVIYSRGLSGAFGSDFSYNKVEAGVWFERYIKGFGKMRASFEVGFIDRSIPFSMNFSGRPSFNQNFSVVIKETFQTMRFNEFSSDQYASLFFMHDFGPLLLRFKYFKPEIRLAQAISYGSLRNRENHVGIPFKTLEKGFFESGLIIDNIIRINMFNTGYFGIGGGVFYRYGPNKLPTESDNWTFKLAFMYSVN